MENTWMEFFLDPTEYHLLDGFRREMGRLSHKYQKELQNEESKIKGDDFVNRFEYDLYRGFLADEHDTAAIQSLSDPLVIIYLLHLIRHI